MLVSFDGWRRWLVKSGGRFRRLANRYVMAADSFDETNPASVLEHARKLKTLTIRQIAERLGRLDQVTRTGKGRAGNVIEMWFGVENDNASEPDLRETMFPGSEYRGLEIKAVPIKRKARDGRYGVKERNVLSMISYRTLPSETWQDAKLRRKMEHLLFVYYLYEGGPDWMQSRVIDVHLWTFANIPEVESRTIRDDWTIIRSKVASGEAHDLHERDTAILKATRKGAGGAEKRVSYLLDAPPAFSRAYSLSRGHMDVVWTRDVQGKPLREISRPGENFESLVLRKLRTLEGKRLRDIDSQATWKGKASASFVIRAALGEIPGRIKEFIEKEITVRVIPFYADTRKPKEAVSFPAMNLKEFVTEDWENATLREYIGCILFVPVLLPTRATKAPDYIVARAFFWRPTDDELKGIEREWAAYQRQVNEGACRTELDSRGRNVSSLKPSSETEYIHMRPHGRDGADCDVDPFGNRIVKQSFWLNQRFVERLYSQNR